MNDFPGLSCDMILVVVNIGSDGLLGTEARFKDRTIVGGGQVDTAVASTETGSPRGCSPE